MASTYPDEKKINNAQKREYSDDLERTQTVYDDNFHGLSLKTILVYLALCIAYFVQLFDIVCSGAYARTIAAAVGTSTDSAVWISQVIVIVTATLGPPASQAADYWGRKWFFVGSSVFGFVGAIVLARAHSIGQVIAGQTISSVFFISQPILIAVGSEILPRKWRPIAQGGLNAAGGLGGVVAFLGGQSLIDQSPSGWRNIWYIITALMGASGIIIATLYWPPPMPLQKTLSASEKFRRLDWVAYFLLAAGLALLCMGLSWAESPYPWSNAHVVACIVVGGMLILALVVHQTFFQKHGLLDHDLFKKDRNFAIAIGCFFLDGMIFWAYNSYFPFEMSTLYAYNSSAIEGARNCMNFFATFFAVALIPVISHFTKSIREPTVISFLAYVVFFALMAKMDVNETGKTWGYPIIMGLGLGWSLTYLVAAAQLSAPAHLIAITSGILLSIRSLGASIALGIYNAIFNSELNSKLGSNIAAAVLPLGLPPQSLEAFIGALASEASESDIAAIPGVTPQIIGAGVAALQKAFLNSFKWVYVAAAVISAVAAIASCFLINPVKDLNNHVDAPLDED
ncbi:uncharacterized protein PV09_02070 [Verruconis gallopava]|uniref:Major facilitator superfamily (MFS) profile domain-containing protein n=1 Tax=Verruconis gallopava TaxID=253628 RepID=A0A0D2AKZ0_9PEZI|nr:uncharacterized protein PV09_02070 [Verruconis gallopava]KIW07205.1 hypothetical protein PV09_02070 [Verruconis gallopava]